VPTQVPAAVEPTTVPTEPPAAEPTTTPIPVETPAPEPTIAPTETPAAAQPAPAAARTFKLEAGRTIARFTLNEKLMGNPVTVVGETSGVEGEITVDAAAPSQSKIGVLKIDARSLKTDSGRRDGAMGRFILESVRDEYQFITFTPTAIEGMPATVEMGKPLAFKVTGDLKIRDVVAPVTFEVAVTMNSENELSGTAKAQVLRSTFNLQIPSVPSVADVTDEVALELEFTAVP
jgi:polyisoprenoid-binding protein YceI